MTIVPGHNIVIQQSGAAHEAAHQVHSPKPTPEQAAAQQQANEVVQGTTVQTFDESEKLKAKKEKDALLRKKALEKARKKKRQAEKSLDPDATGRLVDTTI